jgi:hypothetical protein
MADDHDDQEQERPEPIVLEMFEGRPVIRTVVAIVGAGDGLSEALGIAPQIIRLGERHRVLMDVTSAKVTYQPAKGFDGPTAPLERKVTLDAETVTILEVGASAHVDQVLAEQRDRIAEKREADRLAKTRQPRLTDEAEAQPNGRANLRAVPADDGTPVDADGFADPALAGAGEDEPL